MEGYLKVVNQNVPTDIIDFIDFKVKAMKFRQEYANRQGICDQYIEKYDRAAALSAFPKKDRHYFFVIVEGQRVGCLELKMQDSPIDRQRVGIIKIIYAEKQNRNYHLFEKVIYDLQEMYPMRLEVDLWYEQPEVGYFRKFGFRNVSMRMTLT